MQRFLIGLVSLSVLAFVSGCGHYYRQAKMAEFEQHVADRCLESARSATPQVIVVPAGASTAPTEVAPQP